MRPFDIERLLMPNTYARQLAQEVGHHDRLADGTGIEASELETLDRPITVRQHLHLLRNTLSLPLAPDWYLRWGRRMGEHFHGPISMAWLSAPTLGEGLDVFLRFIPARVPYHDWQGYPDEGTFVASLTPMADFGAVGRMLVEVPMLVLHEYVRRLRPGGMGQARIELAQSPPAHQARYQQWFDCPVSFNAGRNALIIPDDWRQMINLGHDPDIWMAALTRCEAICGVSEDRSTLSRVREILFEEIERGELEGFAPTLEDVAQRLHCSPRTLIRRLKAMNTRYHEVVDKVKKQRACELLANPNLRIHEIGEVLGYRDAASFNRSFKRCLGVTPGQYRRQLEAHCLQA